MSQLLPHDFDGRPYSEGANKSLITQTNWFHACGAFGGNCDYWCVGRVAVASRSSGP